MLDNRRKEKKANEYNALKTCGWGNCSQVMSIFCNNAMETMLLIFGVKGAFIFNDFIKSDNLSSLNGDVSIPCNIYIALIPAM